MKSAIKKVYAEDMIFYDKEKPKMDRDTFIASNNFAEPSRGVYRLLYINAENPIWVDKNYNEIPSSWAAILDKLFFDL